jgi:hypothetical protein
MVVSSHLTGDFFRINIDSGENVEILGNEGLTLKVKREDN